MNSRVRLKHCQGIAVDVQEFFLKQLERAERNRIEARTESCISLLNYLGIPVTYTVERPLENKGRIPAQISGSQPALQKNFFDLTKEASIVDHIGRIGKKQILLFGCETDVCILQSCLGLIDLGYEVFVIEDLLFSSSLLVEAAVERMKNNGAIFLTYKSLYHELLESVEESPWREDIAMVCGPLPQSLSELEFE